MARRQTGKARPWWIVWLLGIAAATLWIYCEFFGYRLSFRERVVTQPVKLYTFIEGMVYNPPGPVAGELKPGDRCHYIQVGWEVMMLNYRVRCGDIEGWTDSPDAFEPNLRSGEWF